MKKTIDLIYKGNFKFDNLPDRPEKPTSEEIADIIYPVPQGVVADTAYHIYDNDEHIVGEWRETIDGVKKKKPVYEKTFKNIATPTTALSDDNILTLDSNVQIMCVDGYLIDSTSSYKFPLNIYYSNSYSITTFFDTNHVKMRVNGWLNNNNTARLTVQYTKTTDQWIAVS